MQEGRGFWLGSLRGYHNFLIFGEGGEGLAFFARVRGLLKVFKHSLAATLSVLHGILVVREVLSHGIV